MNEDKDFAKKISSCLGSFNASTVYSDGGVEYQHGMWGNSPCTCGTPEHYTSPEGGVYDDLWDYNRRMGF